MLNGIHSQVASEAALFESAKWKSCIHQAVGIDPDGAGFQAPGKLMRLLNVICPNGGRQTVNVFIGEVCDFVNVVEAQRSQDRTKDFFLSDLHVVLHSAKNGGLAEIAVFAVDRSSLATC